MHVGGGAGDTRNALERLLHERSVRAVFQPIVDLSNGEILGFETLTRPGPDSGFANPGELFDAAEAEQLLWPLEALTREMALEAASSWPAGRLLFLNSSPNVFADARFAQAIADLVQATPGLTPNRVVLEITERSDQQFVDGLVEQVQRVKELGFQVAIDDVGAGTSGLNRIMALRPHWLKLDRALVDQIDRDRVRQNLVRFFVHFARLTGVRMIAEGIERREDLAALIELGVPFAQGYFLGKPGSREQTLAPELAGWLRSTWLSADMVRFRDPAWARISRFARPVLTADADQPIREVRTRLLSAKESLGIVVTQGERIVGWCGRDAVIGASPDCSRAIATLVSPAAITATTDTSLTEALDLAASRGEASVASPLLLLDGQRVVGMLTVHDLLNAAAEATREVHLRTAPLTGLPGRVRCDEHIGELLSGRYESIGSARSGPAYDAALVDIRGLADFNGTYGYELGDQLLRHLAAMLQRYVAQLDPPAFLGHLNDDRFLVTARREVLAPRLRRLGERFDALVESQSPLLNEYTSTREPGLTLAPAANGSAPGGDRVGTLFRGAGVGLRILLVPDVASHAGDVREFHRLITALKERHDAQTTTDGPRGSCMLVAGAEPVLKLTA